MLIKLDVAELFFVQEIEFDLEPLDSKFMSSFVINSFDKGLFTRKNVGNTGDGGTYLIKPEGISNAEDASEVVMLYRNRLIISFLRAENLEDWKKFRKNIIDLMSSTIETLNLSSQFSQSVKYVENRLTLEIPTSRFNLSGSIPAFLSEELASISGGTGRKRLVNLNLSIEEDDVKNRFYLNFKSKSKSKGKDTVQLVLGFPITLQEIEKLGDFPEGIYAKSEQLEESMIAEFGDFINQFIT